MSDNNSDNESNTDEKIATGEIHDTSLRIVVSGTINQSIYRKGKKKFKRRTQLFRLKVKVLVFRFQNLELDSTGNANSLN